MKFKQLRMFLPTAVLIMAVLGAFAFNTAESETLVAPEDGFINLPGQPCAIKVECNNNPGLICTAIYNGNSYQAFGKTSEVPLLCQKVLSRKMNP